MSVSKYPLTLSPSPLPQPPNKTADYLIDLLPLLDRKEEKEENMEGGRKGGRKSNGERKRKRQTETHREMEKKIHVLVIKNNVIRGQKK